MIVLLVPAPRFLSQLGVHCRPSTHLDGRLPQPSSQLLDNAANLGVQDDPQGCALLGSRRASLPQRRRIFRASGLARGTEKQSVFGGHLP